MIPSAISDKRQIKLRYIYLVLTTNFEFLRLVIIKSLAPFADIMDFEYYLRKGAKKKLKKKLTNVSFMYVCVAGNGEMLVFFSFFPPTIV